MNRLDLSERLHQLAETLAQHKLVPTIAAVAQTPEATQSFRDAVMCNVYWHQTPHRAEYFADIHAGRREI